MDEIDLPVGSFFNANNGISLVVKAVDYNICRECYFYYLNNKNSKECYKYVCNASYRKDRKYVIFKEIK